MRPLDRTEREGSVKRYTDAHILRQKQYLNNLADYSLGCSVLSKQISDTINEHHINEVMDYGSGIGRIIQLLTLDHPIRYFPYDPSVPQFSLRPEPKPLCLAINVLEYCEPQFIESIIEEIANCSTKMTFIGINSALPGNITRSIDKPSDWWICKLANAFDLFTFHKYKGGFYTLAEPLHLRSTAPDKQSNTALQTQAGS